MSKVQQAVAMFEDSFNCSQAILATYGPQHGLSQLDGLRVGCGFGGGMRRAETCGAVTGALMVLGLRYGPKNPQDKSAKETVYAHVIDFCSRFESRCGSITCRDLLGCDLSTLEGKQQAVATDLFKTVCPKMVEAAAEILEQIC